MLLSNGNGNGQEEWQELTSTHWTPLTIIGRSESDLTHLPLSIYDPRSLEKTHAISCQFKSGSTPANIASLTPLVLSLFSLTPLLGPSNSPFSLKSRSRFPPIGASAVRKIASILRLLTFLITSVAFCRSRLTYSWKKRGCEGARTAAISSREQDAFEDIYARLLGEVQGALQE